MPDRPTSRPTKNGKPGAADAKSAAERLAARDEAFAKFHRIVTSRPADAQKAAYEEMSEAAVRGAP